jgi:hypothetical protein
VGQTNNFYAAKNKIINGDFFVNQRGFTTTTTDNVYTFDRWNSSASDGTSTFSSQSFTPGTAPVAGHEAANFLSIASTGQTLTTANTQIRQRIEDVRTFANQTVTVSFWAKADSGTPKIAVEFDQQFGSGGSTRVTAYAGSITTSTSFARYSVSILVPSISGKTIGSSSFLSLNLWTSAGSFFNSRTGSLGIQTTTISMWGVQVEAGSTATAFQTATGTIQGELAACQRYYERRTVGGANYGTGINGVCVSTTGAATSVTFATPKRVNPSAAFGGSLAILGGAINAAVTSVSGVFGAGTASSGYIGGDLNANAASGLTTGSAIWLKDNGAGTAFLEFSAEL